MTGRIDERTELEDVVEIERSRLEDFAIRAGRADALLAERERALAAARVREASTRAACGALIRVAGDRAAAAAQPGASGGVAARLGALVRARLEAASSVRHADAARAAAEAHTRQLHEELLRVEERVRALEKTIDSQRAERLARRADDAEHEAIEESGRRISNEALP